MIKTDSRQETAKIVPMIEVIRIKGKGIESDPMIRVKQYWTMEGVLLVEFPIN